MEEKKIVFVLEHFSPHIGGAETLFANLIKSLDKKKYKVLVLTSNSSGYAGRKKFFGATVIYHSWPSIFGHPIPLFKDICSYVKEADIVHTSLYSSALITFFISRHYKKKCILTVYECLNKKWFYIEKNFLRALFFLLVERLSLSPKYAQIIAISNSTKNDLEKIGIKNVFVVYPILDEYSQKTTNINRDGPRKFFLYFGRPGKTKGIFTLLEAVKLINIRKQEFQYRFLLILSNDPLSERKKITQFIRKYNLGKLVLVVDSVPKKELNGYISNSYCCIVPSLTEGFGYSAAEVCALKKPIIISNTPSLLEIAYGKVIIFLNNKSEDLYLAIIKAVDDRFCLVKKDMIIFNSKKQIKTLNDIYSLK